MIKSEKFGDYTKYTSDNDGEIVLILGNEANGLIKTPHGKYRRVFTFSDDIFTDLGIEGFFKYIIDYTWIGYRQWEKSQATSAPKTQKFCLCSEGNCLELKDPDRVCKGWVK